MGSKRRSGSWSLNIERPGRSVAYAGVSFRRWEGWRESILWGVFGSSFIGLRKTSIVIEFSVLVMPNSEESEREI